MPKMPGYGPQSKSLLVGTYNKTVKKEKHSEGLERDTTSVTTGRSEYKATRHWCANFQKLEWHMTQDLWLLQKKLSNLKGRAIRQQLNSPKPA